MKPENVCSDLKVSGWRLGTVAEIAPSVRRRSAIGVCPHSGTWMSRRLITLTRHLSPSTIRRIGTMSTMKAIQISKPGGVEALEYNDIPIPSPGEGQVLVKIAYSGVNFIDTHIPSLDTIDI